MDTTRRSLSSSYDAVVIGAGNGGLAAALTLAVNGVKPLLLERHNIPGGFATSFVRGRFEFDASLHELSDVGPDEKKGGVRQFLDDEAGLDIDWVRIPEAYRVILKDHDINLRVPFGEKAFIDAVSGAVPGSREPVEKYMKLCRDVYDVLGYLGKHSGVPNPARAVADFSNMLMSAGNPLSGAKEAMEKFSNFLTNVARTVDEATEPFGIPEKALKIIYPYWCYMGIPTSRLGFVIWAAMLISYLEKGAYVPRMRCQEMTMAMEARIRELGGHVEYNAKVEKIFVEKGRVSGVLTEAGDRINTGTVVSNASQSLVYGGMIHPKRETPAVAKRYINTRIHAPSAFVVYMGLDAPPDELGLEDYGYFISDDMNTDELYDSLSVLGPTKMQATTCLNNAVTDCTPPGTTMLCITILHQPSAWEGVHQKDYFETKRSIAGALIKQLEEATGADVSGHIEEIEIATPVTFSRYTGAYKGIIYGYEPEPWDTAVARSMALKEEQFIGGLEFAGGNSFMGHGYSPSLLSGRGAALAAIEKMGVRK